MRTMLISILLAHFLPLILPAQRGDLVLVGKVLDTSGNAIPGAEVFAQPNKIRSCDTQGFCLYGYHDEAIGWQCPICVGDLGVRGRCDQEGRFSIANLPSTFAHYVVASAPGYKSDWVGPIYPEEGPIEITLEPVGETRSPLRDRILDMNGEPIDRASVLVVGQKRGPELSWSRKGLDRLVSTGPDGRFVITSDDLPDVLYLRIQAEGHARLMAELKRSVEEQSLQLQPGTEITGRILDVNAPLADVELVLVQSDRYPLRFLGPMSVRSDAEGRFRFPAVTRGVNYRLFAALTSLKGRGCLRFRELSLNADKKLFDVGDLIVEAGYSLRGRLQSSDGSRLPNGIRVLVTRPDTWELISVDVDEEGRFVLDDYPPELINLAFTVPGYHLSKANPNRDPQEHACLLGRLERDVEGLVVVLSPGPDGEAAGPEAGWRAAALGSGR